MDRFRNTGIWTPLGNRQRSKVLREYVRCVRAAAGACEKFSSRAEQFCNDNFSSWWRDVSEMQFDLARQVGLFYLANGRLPHRHHAREAFLAAFVERARHLRLCRRAQRYLNRYAPGWRVNHEEVQSLHLLEMLRVDQAFREE